MIELWIFVVSVCGKRLECGKRLVTRQQRFELSGAAGSVAIIRQDGFRESTTQDGCG
jgi:hypothetical protein